MGAFRNVKERKKARNKERSSTSGHFPNNVRAPEHFFLTFGVSVKHTKSSIGAIKISVAVIVVKRCSLLSSVYFFFASPDTWHGSLTFRSFYDDAPIKRGSLTTLSA